MFLCYAFCSVSEQRSLVVALICLVDYVQAEKKDTVGVQEQVS